MIVRTADNDDDGRKFMQRTTAAKETAKLRPDGSITVLQNEKKAVAQGPIRRKAEKQTAPTFNKPAAVVSPAAPSFDDKIPLVITVRVLSEDELDELADDLNDYFFY